MSWSSFSLLGLYKVRQAGRPDDVMSHGGVVASAGLRLTAGLTVPGRVVDYDVGQATPDFPKALHVGQSTLAARITYFGTALPTYYLSRYLPWLR